MKDFNIGDVVTIRQFDGMADEFNKGNMYADIAGPPGCYAFITDMKKYCGKQFTIRNVHDDDSPWAMITEPWYDLSDDNGFVVSFYFHSWMFEESKEDEGKIFIEPEYQIDFLLGGD